MSRKNRFVKLTEEQRLELEAAFQVDGRPVFRQERGCTASSTALFPLEAPLPPPLQRGDLP